MIGILSLLLLVSAACGLGQTGVRPRVTQSQEATFDRAKYVGLATVLYSIGHNGTYPVGKSTAEIFKKLAPYVKSKNAFESENPNGKHFLFNLSISGLKASDVKRPQAVIVAYDEKPWPDNSRIAVFGDGHVEKLLPATWKVVAQSLKFSAKR